MIRRSVSSINVDTVVTTLLLRPSLTTFRETNRSIVAQKRPFFKSVHLPSTADT